MFTQDQVQAFAQAINMGQSISAIARTHGVTRSDVYRAAARYGVRIARRRAVRSLRAAVREMSAPHAIEFLLDLIEASVPEHSPERLQRFRRFGFSAQQAQILCALWEASPQTVLIDNLCLRMGGRDAGSVGCLRVQIARARRTLRDIGWPIEIICTRDVGYALIVTEPGWTGPL